MGCSTIDQCIVTAPQESDFLSTLLRQGAQKMLSQAIEAEVADWIDRHAQLRDDRGHRQVVRNGSMPNRTITTGVGRQGVRYPRSIMLAALARTMDATLLTTDNDFRALADIKAEDWMKS